LRYQTRETRRLTEERSKNYFSKLERELDELRILLKARVKRLTPGTLVKVITTPDSSLYEKSFDGIVGMILENEVNNFSSSMFRILIDDKIVVCHALDLVVIETELTEETYNE